MSRYLLCTTTLLIVGASACWLSLRLSSHGFSGYDVSPMIDAGWRVYSGQVPGRDFVVTFPASLYLLTALCFRFLGVTWPAIAMGTCWVYGLLLLLGLRVGALVRASLGARVAIPLSIAYTIAQTIPLISINYLWHASLAESFGIYAVFAALVCVSTAPTNRSWARREAMLHLALACACLLLSKPNTGYPVVLLCLYAMVRSGLRKGHAGLLLATAAALATVALARVHVTPWGMLLSYAGLGGRLVPKAFVNGILFALYARYGLANLLVYAILAPAICSALVLSWKGRHTLTANPMQILGVGSILIALFGMGTNFDFKLTDTPLAIMGLAILSYCGSPLLALRFRTSVATGALLLLALYFGRTRLRMQIVGSWADDKCPAQVSFHDTFFGSIRTCPVVPETLAEVDRTLNASPGQRIFFGPGLEFLYAARRLPSPLHLPDWWDPGTSFPLRESAQIAAAWSKDRFDFLIFDPGEDLAQLPAGIVRDLHQRYVLVPGTTAIHVYRPK